MDAGAITHNNDATERADRKHRFQPGNNQNPKGRPKGSRNKLSEAFICAMYEAWEEQGNSVIQRVIETRPQDFLKIIANILPKDVNLKVSTTEDMSDEQLMRKLAALTEMARPLLARVVDGADARAEPAVDVEYTEISKA